MTIQHEIQSVAADRPKYLAIADAIEAAMRSGSLEPDNALPTHRELAQDLGVTVGTVTRGYAEAARRGLVRGETGRGTFVMSQKAGFASLGNEGDRNVDLGLAASFHSLAPSLAVTLSDLAAEPDLHRYLRLEETRGLPEHRQAGARWAGMHGHQTDPEQVLVCAGAQHGLLAAMAALFSPGDRVAVEGLTYPLVKPVAKRLRLELVPIPMDENGLKPEALDAACRREVVRGLYTMPSCQNPTGAFMPEYRRVEVAELCRRHGLRIVEDDVYGLMADTTLPSLSTLAPELGCFIASTSKVLAGGLRTAFVCVSPGMRHGLESAIEASAWKAAPLMAEITSRWIMDGTAARAIKANRAEARVRTAMAAEILAGHNIRTRQAPGFVWLPLPRGWRSVDFAETAAQRGVIVAHMEHFAVGSAQPGQGVRLSLLGVRERQALRRGLETLAEVLKW